MNESGNRRTKVSLLVLFLLIGLTTLVNGGQAKKLAVNTAPSIPKTWDDEAFTSYELPLANNTVTRTPFSSDYYYKMQERKIYKSYPVYAPGKEPADYMEWLKQQEPEVLFDSSNFKTEADWIKAGAVIYDTPTFPSDETRIANLKDPEWYKRVGNVVAKDGTVPFFRYVIKEKGNVVLTEFSCATCHTRVMPDGSVFKGVQGNFPVFRQGGPNIRARAAAAKAAGKDENQTLAQIRLGNRFSYSTPWMKPDPNARLYEEMSVEEIAAAFEAIPPGVAARFHTSLFYPAQIPDLIGVKERRYLDHTGIVRHRSIADLMRYSAIVSNGEGFVYHYGDFQPGKQLPDPTKQARFSDEQLYALATYIYSLKPPPNPNRFGPLAARGKVLFNREGCVTCHTPPLYTNNKLTPVDGFKVPDDHMKKYDILPISVGTDPGLALNTRKGTGYYKVPSLRGVWYRGPFEHSGSVATLEDWFDPGRMSDSYVPTGFVGIGVKNRAVKGHPFGLNLTERDRRALIAFLKTL